MTKKLIYFTMALLIAGIFLWACSGDTGGEPEKGAVRKMTDQVAHELVHKMRDPIDKARSVKTQQEDRLNDRQNAFE